MAATARSFVRARVDDSPRTLWIAAADLLAIVAFVVSGQYSHGVDPLAAPLGVVEAAVPFALGWALAGVLAGAYAPRALRSPRAAVTATAFGWLGGALLGQALRATPLFAGDAAPAFVIVSILVGWLLLVPLRSLVARLG